VEAPESIAQKFNAVSARPVGLGEVGGDVVVVRTSKRSISVG